MKPTDFSDVEIASVYAALGGDPQSRHIAGDETAFRCLQHKPDDNPSLRLNLKKGVWTCDPCGKAGGILELVVFAGEAKDPMGAAKWLRDAGLLSPRTRMTRAKGRRSIPPQSTATPQQSGCSLADYGAAKKLDVERLQAFGLTDTTYDGVPAIRMPYMGADGVERAVRFRIALAKTDLGDNRFRWKSGAHPSLYGLWRIPEFRKKNFIVVVEGESDCHTLWSAGIAAVGIPGAGNWREDRDAPSLAGFSRIYVVLEPDAGGETVRRWLAKSAIRDRAFLVRLGAWSDPSEMYVADPTAFPDRWAAAIDSAEAWSAVASRIHETGNREAWDRCAELAGDPRVLDLFAEDVRRLGVVGEERTAKLLYLIIVSRHLDRPVSAVVKGPSSAGKSFLVDRVLQFFSEGAYFPLTAGSERSLVYSEEPIAHRILVIYEAAGLVGDLSTYLVRSLLSEGCIRYETVEKTSEGLRPRLIFREGPAGLLVTTTAVKLHAENETRLFSVPVSDSAEQTKRVLISLADETTRADVDLAPWKALDTWLEGSEHRVTIPFGRSLAEMIPPSAVRLRRDFGAILNLIRTHTVLHQVSRARDATGKIIATLDDYAVVRDLVGDLVADGIALSVSPTTRETVEAVGRLSGDECREVSVRKIAAEIKLDKSSASRRVSVAIERGFLANREDKKGKPARIVLADPLPENAEVLPSLEEIDRCSVAAETEGTDPSLADEELVG